MAGIIHGVMVKTNEELLAEEREAIRKDTEDRQNQTHILGLAAYVRTCWQAARDAKVTVEESMLKSLRARLGKYDPDKRAQIEEYGQVPIYMMLTAEKCFHAESWIEDILSPADDHPWGIDPTKVPELSPEKMQQVDDKFRQKVYQLAMQQVKEEQVLAYQQTGQMPNPAAVMQEVQQRAADLYQQYKGITEEYADFIKAKAQEQAKKADAEIEEIIADEMEEAEWEDALRNALPDIVGSKAGFVKGPIIKRKKVMCWGKDSETGETVPVMEHKLVKEYTSPSPFDMYPGPDSSDIGDTYLIELHRMTRKDFINLLGVKGYDEGAIRGVLEDYGRGGLRNWLYLHNQQQREELEGRDTSRIGGNDTKIEAIQFWGSVQGYHLLEFGIDPARIPDPAAEYDAEVWLVGNYVIKAELNSDPLGKPPYFKASFREVKGSFWGLGLPEVIADIQDVVNSTARALLDNMALGSGAQVGVDIGAMAKGEEISEMYPGKIWQFDMGKNPASGRTPIWFFQPKIIAGELMKVYKDFSDEADLKSGVPKYSYGAGGTGGALATVGGMSMMMNAAARGIKKVIRNIDKGIISGSVKRMWRWLMLYDDRQVLRRGDIKVVAQGSGALMQREHQTVRRNEFLQIVLNPAVLGIIQQTGLTEVLRPMLRDLGYDVDKIIPSQFELTNTPLNPQQQPAIPQQGMMPGQQPAIQQGTQLDAAGNPLGGVDQQMASPQGGM
jgi:hypothetical protein